MKEGSVCSTYLERTREHNTPHAFYTVLHRHALNDVLSQQGKPVSEKRHVLRCD